MVTIEQLIVLIEEVLGKEIPIRDLDKSDSYGVRFWIDQTRYRVSLYLTVETFDGCMLHRTRSGEIIQFGLKQAAKRLGFID